MGGCVEDPLKYLIKRAKKTEEQEQKELETAKASDFYGRSVDPYFVEDRIQLPPREAIRQPICLDNNLSYVRFSMLLFNNAIAFI